MSSILILVILLFIIIAFYPSFLKPIKNALPIPSPPHQRKVIYNIIKDYQTTTQKPLKVVELGAGWGGMATSVTKIPNVTFIGIEYNIMLFIICKFKSLFFKNKPKYILKDAYKYNLEDSDVLVIFMGTSFNTYISKKIPQNKLIISSYFPIPNLTPLLIEKGIYIYKT